MTKKQDWRNGAMEGYERLNNELINGKPFSQDNVKEFLRRRDVVFTEIRNNVEKSMTAGGVPAYRIKKMMNLGQFAVPAYEGTQVPDWNATIKFMAQIVMDRIDEIVYANDGQTVKNKKSPEKIKNTRGRKAGDGKIDDEGHLDKIDQIIINEKISPWAASQKVAEMDGVKGASMQAKSYRLLTKIKERHRQK